MTIFNDFSSIESIEYLEGFHGQMLHLNGFTFARWRIEAGSVLPAHAHPHEQLSHVLEGEFEMTVNEETQICRAGGVVCIPSNVIHAGRAITDCILVDVFQPAREDYKAKRAS